MVTSSVNPSTVGPAVTFTATVTSGGTPVTAGTVDFTEGATTLAAGVTLNGSGQATFTTSALTAGSHPITAAYNGTPALAASTGSVSQQVDWPPPPPLLGSAPNPSGVGVPVTFTATVTSGGTPVTAGTVDFTEGHHPGRRGHTRQLRPGHLHHLDAHRRLAPDHRRLQRHSGVRDEQRRGQPGRARQAATSTGLTSSVNPSTVGQR